MALNLVKFHAILCLKEFDFYEKKKKKNAEKSVTEHLDFIFLGGRGMLPDP